MRKKIALAAGGMAAALALAPIPASQVPAESFPAGYQYILTPDGRNPGKFLAVDVETTSDGKQHLVLNPAKTGVQSQHWSARYAAAGKGLQFVKLYNKKANKCLGWEPSLNLTSCASAGVTWKQHYKGSKIAFQSDAPRLLGKLHFCLEPIGRSLSWGECKASTTAQYWSFAKAR